MPSATHPNYQPARFVLRTVAELHVRGYQRLRIAPGMSPSGVHWRCMLTPVCNIVRWHGARIWRAGWLTAAYTSANGRRYFDWADAEHAEPAELARLFVERFPAIAEAAYGEDWSYAGWYQHMLHRTYPNAFPIAYADYQTETPSLATAGGDPAGVSISPPPPGEASDDAGGAEPQAASH